MVTLYMYQQLSLTFGFLEQSAVSFLASGSISVECSQKEGNIDGAVYACAANVYFSVTMTDVNGTSLVVIITYAEYSISNHNYGIEVHLAIGCMMI